MFSESIVICFSLVSALICHINANDLVGDRIVGGVQQLITDNRQFQVVVMPDGYLCGGSLIKWNWVLTAAHCTYGLGAAKVTVRVGSNYADRGGKEVGVEKVINHNTFNMNTLTHDIALLKLNTMLTQTSTVNIIQIAPRVPVPGVEVIVSGYGTTSSGGYVSDYLESVTIEVIDTNLCNTRYGGGLTNTMFCAGNLSGGEDSCQGDSGGPITTKDGLLIGVVSWGYECGTAKYPGVYTKVPMFAGWIETNILAN